MSRARRSAINLTVDPPPPPSTSPSPSNAGSSLFSDLLFQLLLVSACVCWVCCSSSSSPWCDLRGSTGSWKLTTYFTCSLLLIFSRLTWGLKTIYLLIPLLLLLLLPDTTHEADCELNANFLLTPLLLLLLLLLLFLMHLEDVGNIGLYVHRNR